MALKRGKTGKEVIGSEVASVKAAKPEERIANTLPHVLVVEDRPVSAFARFKKRAKEFLNNKRHRKVAAIAAAGFVVILVLAIFLLADEPEPVVDNGPKCTYAMLEKAKPNLGATKVAKLEPQVKEIEQISGYDQDVNCLYVLLTYSINTGDAARARELYDKLDKVYVTGEGYETVIVDVAKKPSALKPDVEALEQQAKQYQDVGPDGAPR
jgi:protein involved in ribonucleotide reduction